ncbi:hypothetical protein GOBAR_DD02145 [Gossypium barbadense]|nr:hypothetical protein GOBAR_DD02145 [Gossypium barbadense]
MGQPQSKPRFLQPGDHIYCEREGGIYMGDDMVIHLQGKAKKLEPLPECRKCKDKRVQNGEIAKVCIDCFLRGEKPRIYDYGVNFLEFLARKGGTCCQRDSKPPREVIRIATYLLELNRFGPYGMLTNNCEHFAVFCKTGSAASYQIECMTRGLVAGLAGRLAAVALGVSKRVRKT